MKKTRLLVALAGLCATAGAAYADDAGVTLYGVADVGVTTQHAGGPGGVSASRAGLVSGGYGDSLFGLKGSEPLSDGWRAEFELESRFDAATGELDDDQFFNNSAWLGLASDDFGSLRFGRQHPVGQQFGSRLEIASWKEMSMGATFKASDNYQIDNNFNYLSPSWGGFSLGLGYSFDVAGDQYSGRHSPHGSAALQYEDGPFLAVATWDKTWISDALLPDARDASAWQLGVVYDFGVARATLAWSRQTNGYAGLDGGDPDNQAIGLGARAFAQGGRLDAYLIGVSVPVMGQDEILAQWSYVDPHWSWDDGSRAQPGQVMTLGYVHSLSPRTKLYVAAGYARHYSLDDQVVQGQGNSSRFMAGINHSF